MVQIETLCETTADGRKKFHGECFYAGVLFKFSGCELKSEKYFAKVTVRIISPDTGKTLQVAGKQRRAIMERLNEHEKQALEAGKQVEKLNASTEVYLPLDDLGDIEERINDAVIRLYEKHQATLATMLKQDAVYLHLYSLFQLYQRDFLASLHIKSKKGYSSKRDTLKDICARLDDMEVEKITVNVLKERFRDEPKKLKAPFGLAESFLNFCHRKGAFYGDNPFSLWKDEMEKRSASVHPDSAARRAAKCRKIDFSKEKSIYDERVKSIEGSYSLLFPLAAYAHLTIEEIIALKWSDILVEDLENERTVIIRNIKPEYTGGVHDFSRPPLPAGKQLILMKRDLLSKEYSESELMELYLVHQPGEPKKAISETKASEELRTCLKKAKVHFSEAFVIGKSGVEKEAYSYNGQAIIQLLHDHYASILEEQCGVDLSSGLGHFLRGELIKDTTTSFYTSLTGEDGKFLLEAILRRDRRFSPACPFVAPQEELTADGEIITAVPSWGKDYISAGEVEFVLRPGESLKLEAHYGVCGNLIILDPDDPNAVLPRFEY